uniref:Uncharacterized protein n=1 Tax=Alexandrium catenella TaxID=2925 RepID=A0A7S1S5L2_ALECA
MDAANAPAGESGGGGSARAAKMFFSVGRGLLTAVAYVPADRLGLLACDEWLDAVLQDVGADLDQCLLPDKFGTDASAQVPVEELRNLGAQDPERALLALPLDVLRERGVLGDDDVNEHLVEVGLGGS